MIVSKQQYIAIGINYFEKFQLAADAGVPKSVFVRCAVSCAKTFLWRARNSEEYNDCFGAIEMAEKYLNGEVTEEQCRTASIDCRLFDEPRDSHYIFAASNAISCAYHNEIDICAEDAARTAWAPSLDPESGQIWKIVEQCLSWDQVLTWQIASTILAGSDRYTEFAEELFRLPTLDREKLLCYADTILACDGLRQEFFFLMKEYAIKEKWIELIFQNSEQQSNTLNSYIT